MQTGSSVPLRPVRDSAFPGFPDRKPDASPPCPSSHQSIRAVPATGTGTIFCTGEGHNEDDFSRKVLRDKEINGDPLSSSSCTTSQHDSFTKGLPDAGMQIDLRRNLSSTTSPTSERGHEVTWKQPVHAGNEPGEDSRYSRLAGGLSHEFEAEYLCARNEQPQSCDNCFIDIRVSEIISLNQLQI